jgi:hypothetical protein
LSCTLRFPQASQRKGAAGGVTDQSIRFPAFDLSAGLAARLSVLSWRDTMTHSVRGLEALGANALDCGPVASTTVTGASATSLTHHQIQSQVTNGSSSLGISAALQTIAPSFTSSTLITATYG